MVGYILHLLGDQSRGAPHHRTHAGQIRGVPVISAQLNFPLYRLNDCNGPAAFLARIPVALQGRPKQAVLLVKSSVDGAAS